MKYVLSKEQVIEADEKAINEFGIPSGILMENAARSAADIIKNILPSLFEGKFYRRHVLILCGSGNNGGDGFALARHLHEDYNVYVFWIGDESKMSSETRINFNVLEKLNIFCQKIEQEKDLNYLNFNAECVVESLIGVGGNEYLRGLIVAILQKANKSAAIKVAIDIPAGLNPNSGYSHHDAFKADHTITMFAPKQGLYLNNGVELVGEIHTANLGVSSKIVKAISNIKIIENDDVTRMLPTRNSKSTKFNFGRIAIVAGSAKMSGAAVLTANAAIKSGAGLVELITPKYNSNISPNVITHEISTDNGFFSKKNYDEVLKYIEKCNVVVFGPGIGSDSQTTLFIKKLYETLNESAVKILDADALRFLNIEYKCKENTVITPHFIEFSRVCNVPLKDVLEDSLNNALTVSSKMNCIVLLKNKPTIITDSKQTYLNIYGNPGMSTAGSGDVLSGIIAGIAAQKLDLLSATALAAFLHSKAGDIYAEKYNQISLTATDLIENLKYVF